MATPLSLLPNSTISNSCISYNMESLVEVLTIEEKVSLLSGTNFVNTAGVSRFNIPALKLADSTSAVKGSSLHNGTPTACFPNTSALAATWDCDLLETMGRSIAAQARHKAAQVVLGPTINIHRDPRGGRNFESFSEDPVLTGHLAAALINGIQSQGVGTCVKHFVANESETMRRKCDSKVDERTLREIYLAPFQWLVREAKPTAIMTSYNKLNGIYTCETPLIKNVLRGEWGFEGMTMSDWFGTTSRLGALEAGLDLEMPGPTVFRGAGLVADIQSGAISEKLLDERVTEVLKFISRTKEAHSTTEEASGQDEQTSALCRKIAAESMVLLKNENHVLPLKLMPKLKVAIIGIPSIIPSSGGGSAAGTPQYVQRPYDSIKAAHPSPEMISFVQGVQIHKVIPMIFSSKLLASNGKHGVDIQYWNDGDEAPVLEEFMPVPHMVIMGRLKPGLKENGFRYEITTILTPETTGLHTLAVHATGSFKLQVDGSEVLSAAEPRINMEDFLFVPITHEFRVAVQMNGGQSYKMELNARSRKPHNDGEPTPHSAKLCFLEEFSDEKAIEEAAAAAQNSDISIVFAGRNSEWEGEGSDLESIMLGETQVAQIKSVAMASKKNGGKVVVVLYGGNPFDVSEWIDDIDGLLFAQYPGQEGGAALADILTGVVNPSGKLPMSWPKTLQYAPTFANFPGRDNGRGVEVNYVEGLKVGYRHYWAGKEDDVRWDFGFGLSYTNFTFSTLKVVRKISGATGEGSLDVFVTVKNTGSVLGAEVVQVYVEDVKASVWRPRKELKGFAKVALHPGESKEVALNLLENYALSYWDVESRLWLAEEGTFIIHVGPLAAEFELEKGFNWNGV